MRKIMIYLSILLTSVMALIVGCNSEQGITENTNEMSISEEETESMDAEPITQENLYEIQIMASRNRSKLQKEQEKLYEFGYLTSISKTYHKGELFYRLRLQDQFVYSDAKIVGEILKEEFDAIKNVWIQKIK